MSKSPKIDLILALNDNYIYMIVNEDTGIAACVDPTLAEPVLEYVNDNNLKLDAIFNTHHHWDHTGGNLKLKKETKCQIIGPEADKERIPGINQMVDEGIEYSWQNLTYHVLNVPGHTKGHIAFWFKQEKILFCGDTLFSIGCGRLFEGSPKQMWNSLKKIRSLPDDTSIYCGHEYTQSNAEFALHLDPHNKDLQQHYDWVKKQRKVNQPTIPSSMKIEKKINPFLRADELELTKQLELELPPEDVFAYIRSKKDTF